MRGINLIPYTVCKSRLCRRILSRLRADLRENPTKQWASRDTLIQSAGSISNSARYHSDANIALGPILKMYIPGQIRISNALNSDGYSTGNAPPSGNNAQILLMGLIGRAAQSGGLGGLVRRRPILTGQKISFEIMPNRFSRQQG